MTSPIKISGTQLDLVRPLLNCVLAISHPQKMLLATMVNGTEWLDRKPRLRLRIGRWETPAEDLKRYIALLESFGTVKSYKDDLNRYADITEIRLETLAPRIDKAEREQALEVLDRLIGHMEKAEAIFSRKIPVNDPHLSTALAVYKSEKKSNDKIFPVERMLKNASVLEEMDGYSALQLHGWTRQGSRYADVFQTTSIETFRIHMQCLRSMRDRLSGQPDKLPNAPPAELGLINNFPHFCSDSAAFLLEKAPAAWIPSEQQEHCTNAMEAASELLIANHSLLLKILQLDMYEKIRAQVQQPVRPRP